MRNYQKGEIVMMRGGLLFVIARDVPCGSHWIKAEMLPNKEPCEVREDRIVAVLEVKP